MTIFHHSFHNFFLLITHEKIYEGKKSKFFKIYIYLSTEYIKNVTKDKFLFLHDLSANSSGRDSN